MRRIRWTLLLSLPIIIRFGFLVIYFVVRLFFSSLELMINGGEFCLIFEFVEFDLQLIVNLDFELVSHRDCNYCLQRNNQAYLTVGNHDPLGRYLDRSLTFWGFLEITLATKDWIEFSQHFPAVLQVVFNLNVKRVDFVIFLQTVRCNTFLLYLLPEPLIILVIPFHSELTNIMDFLFMVVLIKIFVLCIN